jgi:hypothetical protein
MGSRMLSLRRFDSTTGERADDAFSMPSGNWRLIKETEFCIEWINNALHPESDPDLVHLLADGGTSGQPLQVEPAEITGPILFKACRDGWLLAKMLNYVEPDLVELKQLRRQSQLMFHHLENCELVIKGARQLGLQIVNFNAENVAKGQANVCLSLIVQIIKVCWGLHDVNLIIFTVCRLLHGKPRILSTLWSVISPPVTRFHHLRAC